MSFERLYYSEREGQGSVLLNHKAKACPEQHDSSSALCYSTGSDLVTLLEGSKRTDMHKENKQNSHLLLSYRKKINSYILQSSFLSKNSDILSIPTRVKKNLLILDKKIIHNFWMIHWSSSDFFLDFLATMPCFATQSLLKSIGLTIN